MTAPAWNPDVEDETPEPTIGTQTAADLLHGDPPEQLADPFLTPEGATVLYGPGGVGKGTIACWLILHLVRTDHVVMIVDYEGHEREWGSRLLGMGGTPVELAAIHYRAPFGPTWTEQTGSMSQVVDLVREDVARVGATFVVVDSYSFATSSGDTMGGQDACREYFTALTRIGRPSLTIAHVKGDAGRFPDKPFGSVFVHNSARETWAVEALSDDDGVEFDPDIIRIGPHIVSLELRNKKANGRGKSSARFLTFSWFADGTIETSTDKFGRSIADLAADILAEKPATLKQIAAAIKEDTAQVVKENSLRVSMKRDPVRFSVSVERPKTWSVR